MAIPNLKPKYETRAKVRVGKKTDRGAPTSVDYFVSDDPEVVQLGGQRHSLLINFPYAEVEDNFSTGMEWWVKPRSGGKSQLACYTKDSGSKPVALRLEPYVDAERDEVVGDKLKQGRVPIACPFRECQMMQDKRCKPMGRLVFFLDGGRTDQVLQLDTKSWNTVERLSAALEGARRGGDLRGRTFELSVAFEQRGRDRFPVCSLQEVDVEISTEPDFRLVEAIAAHSLSVDAGDEPRVTLARMLDKLSPGWREQQPVLDRIKQVGVETSIQLILDKAA